jgi:hypothetical protein
MQSEVEEMKDYNKEAEKLLPKKIDWEFCDSPNFNQAIDDCKPIVAKLLKEIDRLKKGYSELLMAVGNKYKGETRHETALKYIKRAEEVNGLEASKTVIEEAPIKDKEEENE